MRLSSLLNIWSAAVIFVICTRLTSSFSFITIKNIHAIMCHSFLYPQSHPSYPAKSSNIPTRNSVNSNRVRGHILSMQSDFNYRNAKVTDLESIANLCVDCFDPSPWYQPLAKPYKVKQQLEQLVIRYQQIADGYKHAMIVCYNGEELIGFTEIGTLPRPPFVKDKSNNTNTQALQSSPENTPVELKNEDLKANIATNGSVDFNDLLQVEKQTTASNDAPYLGNVAVVDTFRRKGIGGKLVQIGCKVAEKWGESELYVVVDTDNLAALKLYNKLGFNILYDERDSIFQSKKSRIFMMKSLT